MKSIIKVLSTSVYFLNKIWSAEDKEIINLLKRVRALFIE